MNDILSLIGSGVTGLTLNIKGEDLLTFADSLIAKAKEQLLPVMVRAAQEQLLSKKEVLEKFNVCPTTLWNWSRSGYLIPVKIGRKVSYRRASNHRARSKMRNLLLTELSVFKEFIVRKRQINDIDSLSALALSIISAADAIILNSVVNVNKAVSYLKGYTAINCYLDNDNAGKTALTELTVIYGSTEIDRSTLYSEFNFMESIIVKLKQDSKTRTSETCNATLNSCKKFRQEEEIMFDCLTSERMEAYEAWHHQR